VKNPVVILGGLALAAGLAFAVAGSANAAPAQSALPGLETFAGSAVVQVRRYRCHRQCVRRRYGVCYRWRKYCR